LSELTAEKFGFTVEISQQSTTNYNAELERELLLGKEPDIFCYTDAENMFSLAADGTAEPLDDWLEEFPTLKEAVSQDRWNCMRYDGKLIAVPGNNPSAVAIGFEARTDVLDELGIDAASIQTMEDMHALLLAAKQQNPSSVPLVPHFGQTLMMLDCDPLNNGLGVLLHNTGTEVVNLYDTPEYEELCNQMHQWYTEGLILKDAPLTNAPNTRLMQMYGGVAFSHRVAEQNVVSVTRSTKQRLTSITLGSKLQNTSVLNIGWCISSRSEHKREGMQLLQYLYTDREAADLLLYGVEGVDYRRLDVDHVTNIDELPANEWSTVHWGQPNCQAASTWVNADGTEVGYTGPMDVITSEAYGFTYTPKIELRPTVNSCLEIVRKYNNALLSGYLDPEEALPLFRSELRAAGIDKVIADKQYQLERWKAKNG
jgi:putative aldouronate transport system substrate-binding protein